MRGNDFLYLCVVNENFRDNARVKTKKKVRMSRVNLYYNNVLCIYIIQFNPLRF